MRFKILVVFCSLSLLSSAQSTTEFRSWTKVSAGIKPAKDYKLEVSGMFRTDSGEGFDRLITAAELSTSPSKNIKYASEFRYCLLFDDAGGNTGLRHRARLRLTAERRYKVATGECSMRYGVQHREVITGSGFRRTDFRVRGTYEHKIKNFQWDPQFNAEYIGSIGRGYNKAFRAGVSADHKLLLGKINIGYFYERNLQLLDPDYHTVSIAFKF